MTRRSKGLQCEFGHVKWEKTHPKHARHFEEARNEVKGLSLFCLQDAHPNLHLCLSVSHTLWVSPLGLVHSDHCVKVVRKAGLFKPRTRRGLISEWLCVDVRMSLPIGSTGELVLGCAPNKQCILMLPCSLLRSDRAVYGCPPDGNLFLYLCH